MNAIEVRRAADGDSFGIAEIHVRSWQAAYRDILADELLDGLSVSERQASWRALLSGSEDRQLTVVAVRGDRDLSGFCSVTLPNRDEGAAEMTPAEIGALYVDPDHWREGAGGAMLSTTLGELSEKGWREVVLWVLPENQPALAFYQRFGFALEEGVEKHEERSGRVVIQLRIALG